MANSDNEQAQKRILMVEDDVSIADIYSILFQAEGFTIKHVAHSEEALATALAFHPDLALLDVMMPGLNGFDVALLLRNAPELANLKIVMLTALNGDIFIEKARELRVDEFLTKSKIDTNEVVEHIKKLLA